MLYTWGAIISFVARACIRAVGGGSGRVDGEDMGSCVHFADFHLGSVRDFIFFELRCILGEVKQRGVHFY